MNLRHVGYRAYQCVFALGARLLPWRQPETITGPGSLADIPARLTRYGARRPLVVASRRQCADPAFQQMLSRLEGYTLFSDIKPNPPVSTVEAAAALYRQAHCDSLVAVGGGSPMDTAKAAAALVVRPGKTSEQLAGLLKVRRAIPPFIAVPTTAGTGSETTIAAVVTGADHHKYAINDLCLIPRCAVLDPLLTASYQAGVAFTRAGVGSVHAIAHTLGGLYGVGHGLANAVLLPVVLRDYGTAAHRRLSRLAELVGLDGDSEADRANAFIDAIFAMNARLGIPTGFTCIREEDLPQMAAWAATEANPTYPVPVIYDRARFIRVIRQVMQ